MLDLGTSCACACSPTSPFERHPDLPNWAYGLIKQSQRSIRALKRLWTIKCFVVFHVRSPCQADLDAHLALRLLPEFPARRPVDGLIRYLLLYTMASSSGGQLNRANIINLSSLVFLFTCREDGPEKSWYGDARSKLNRYKASLGPG